VRELAGVGRRRFIIEVDIIPRIIHFFVRWRR